MKLCIVTSSFAVNPDDGRAAAGLFVRDFAEELAKRKLDVWVLTQDTDVSRRQPPSGVNVHWYKWRAARMRASRLSPLRPSGFLATVSLVTAGMHALLKLHETERFSHVLAMWAVPSGLLARILKRVWGVPYTVWCLGSDVNVYGRKLWSRPLLQNVLRSARLVLCNSYTLGERVRELFDVGYEFLPSATRIRPLRRITRPIERNNPQFVFLGRYSYEKGPDVLMRASHKYFAAGNVGRVVFFGSGPMEQEMHQFVDRHGLGDRVSIHGFVSPHRAGQILEESSAIVIPSRSESLPAVFSEALHRNTLIVASDVGDTGRLLREIQFGVVVPPEDECALCEAMRTVLSVRWPANTESLAAVKKMFDIERISLDFLSFL